MAGVAAWRSPRGYVVEPEVAVQRERGLAAIGSGRARAATGAEFAEQQWPQKVRAAILAGVVLPRSMFKKGTHTDTGHATMFRVQCDLVGGMGVGFVLLGELLVPDTLRDRVRASS